MGFLEILTIFVAGIFVNNYALVHFLGTGAMLENERPVKKSLTLGLGTTVVMLITTALTWVINKYLLADLTYLQPLVFVVIILAVVELLHIPAKKLLDGYCRADFVKFAINGAVLGLCIHNTGVGFDRAMLEAFSIGIGFMLVITLFAKLKDIPVDEDAIPAPFRGLPIALLTAGMIALAFVALAFNFA